MIFPPRNNLANRRYFSRFLCLEVLVRETVSQRVSAIVNWLDCVTKLIAKQILKIAMVKLAKPTNFLRFIVLLKAEP